MAKRSKATTQGSQEVSVGTQKDPQCLAIATKGIETGKQFAQFMSALMGDLITGAVTAGVGNATCNAGGKLLKVVEMQHRYGVKGGNNEQELRLT